MTEKRFIKFMTQNSDDGQLNCGFYDTVEKESYHTKDTMNAKKCVDLLNELSNENEKLKSENEKYRNMFFEIVETALTDKNCRELYCKGILDIFDKANSLNQAREMIKEHLK